MAIITLLTVILEIPALIKNKMWKEVTAVLLMISIAVFIQTSVLLNVPTLISLIRKTFEPIGKLFFTKL